MSNFKIILAITGLTIFGVAFSQTATLGNWWSSGSNQYYNPQQTAVTTSSANNTNIIPVTTSTSVGLTKEDDKNSNYIRDDVDYLLDRLSSQYALNPAQKSAMDQVARSYQYILTTTPKDSSAAYQVGVREAASTNCASSRLPDNIMDIVFAQIENATINTPERKIAYNNYINLLQESALHNTPVSSSACEDQYSNNTTIDNTNNTNVSTGISNFNMPCLVLNRFMEKGASGQQVSELQSFLVLTGDLNVWPTGYFGVNTYNAVKNFQSRYGIDSRYAWVGPSTRSKIAELTCNADPNAIARAKNGYTLTSSSNHSSSVGSVTTAPTTQVVIPPTTSTVIQTTTNTNQGETILSSGSGVFDLTKNPVNSLYFTVRTNLQLENLYMCLEKSSDSNCYTSAAYSLVDTKHDPTSYDSIANNDRWMFSIYYNSNNWGKTGGKIYIKKGVNVIPSTYTVQVKS